MILALWLACGPTLDQELAFEDGFARGCVAECTTAGGGATCAGYCSCLGREIRTGGHVEALKQAADAGRAAELMREPVFVDAIARCGGEFVDASFRASCEPQCAEDPACGARCACVLGKLRAGRSPVEGTRWLYENLGPTTSEAVQAEVAAAVTACDGARGP